MGIFGGGHTVTNRADRIGDFQINSASYGEVVPEILGTTRVSGNIIYWDDFTAHEHRDVQRTGKGGGGSKVVNITYTYTVAVAIGLCEGPIYDVGTVWRDKEIYTYPQSGIELTLFNGGQGQSPWSYTQSKHPDKALPYSGLAYMAGVVNLGDRGSLPNFNFEVKGKLLDTGDGIDVNPADYILHVLKGIGIDAGNIDGLDNYRKYCGSANILISTPPDGGAKKVQKIVNDIAEITNSYVFWSHDRLKIVPLADKPIGGWSPENEIKYDLTADDFLPMSNGTLVSYRRKDSSECYNQATVEFINRNSGYEKECVTFDIISDIQHNGLRPAPMVTAHYLYTKERASFYAEQLAMKRLYAKNQYVFKLDWAFCRLEPGDLVTITEKSVGLDHRVVVITDVKESLNGDIEITAIGKPPGMYSPAKYIVHEVERPSTDYNMPGKDITSLTIIQPPVDLTTSGNEIWLGVTGDENFGGCEVWGSDSGIQYKNYGQINRQARVGALVGSMSAEDTSCTVSMLHGELKAGSHNDAERGNTLCWIGGECFSYEGAELQSNGNYKLTGIIRGQYNTTPRQHSDGDRFARLDEAFVHQRYRDEDIDKKIYLKFTTYNTFGGGVQDMADVRAYEYSIQPYYIPEVSELMVYTRYNDLGRGVKAYDIVAKFKIPELESYDITECYYREGTGEWKYGGNGSGQITISGLELGHTYEFKVQVKDKYSHYSQGLVKELLVSMKAEVPNTPNGFSITFSDKAYFNWLEVTNSDIDFYEVRINNNPGQQDGLIAKSNNTTANGVLQSRTGQVYLFSHNPVKGYSAPAMLKYNAPVPPQPTMLKVKATVSGLAISFAPIPAGCRGANIYVDDNSYMTVANATMIPIEPGVHDVSVSYVDIFGEGPRTEKQRVTAKVTISADMLADEAITADKIDKALMQKLQEDSKATQEIKTLKDQVTTIVNNLNSDNPSYTAIIQLKDALSLKVNRNDVVSAINMSPDGVKIDGKYLHVTGQSIFDDNIVTRKMLQAGSVTADKMQVDSLSAISADLGAVKAGTIQGIEIKGSLIDGKTLKASGLQIVASAKDTYYVDCGDIITLPKGYTIDEATFFFEQIYKTNGNREKVEGVRKQVDSMSYQQGNSKTDTITESESGRGPWKECSRLYVEFEITRTTSALLYLINDGHKNKLMFLGIYNSKVSNILSRRCTWAETVPRIYENSKYNYTNTAGAKIVCICYKEQD